MSYKPRTKKNSGVLNVQPKLKIGQPGDKYEREADAVADRVTKMNDGKKARDNLDLTTVCKRRDDPSLGDSVGDDDRPCYQRYSANTH